VLLVEDTQQRSKWVMGRIFETNPDKRGLVRTVLVKTPTNIVKTPITKLCPVEIKIAEHCLIFCDFILHCADIVNCCCVCNLSSIDLCL